MGGEWGGWWAGWAAGDRLYPLLGLFGVAMSLESVSHRVPRHA